MQTLILPGYSVANREWAYLVASKLTVDGQIRPIYWDHWTDPEYKFVPEEKAHLISLHTKGDEANIIAKSIGSYVAALIINKIPDQIRKVIICGIPLRDIADDEKDIISQSLVSLKPDSLLCFQNDNDPHGPYEEVRFFLPPQITLIKGERTDHEYPYFDEFDKFLKI